MRICLLALLLFAAPLLANEAGKLPPGSAIDRQVDGVLARTGAKGLAIAVIDRGKVVYVKAYGARNAKGEPLRTDTIMYGASLTKTVFAYTVMRLVDQGRIDLDTPIAADLDKPLPDYDTEAIYPNKYGPYKDLAGDDRWKRITPRMVLTHSTGFLNFYWLEPDRKLRIHFEPGSRFSYSGEGMILLQFVIENGRRSQGLGLDVGDLVRKNVFEPLGMKRSSLMWRADFADNLADGWNEKGEPQPHDERSKVRAAGSMDTTIDDLSKFAAALASGKGLSPASRMEMIKPQLHIGTRTEFPPLQKDLPVDQQRKDLYAGLGVIVFDGPQGHGFFKGGHDEQTGNTLVCIEARERCVLVLANDVRAEAGFADLVHFILGDTGVPYAWEYGDQAGKSN
ncbi:MAG TPA: serine hydrolase domain-containing protein [Rhodanobacteraceae bacterium]|nr:serine hydrolase domain-containing protein [Rhodanobacteraceae bacterium]